MKGLVKLAALAVAVYAVATKSGRERLKRAQEAYGKEVASGAKPIEGVGTAIAAFIGSPGVVMEEGPEPPVGTSTAEPVGDEPEKP